MSQIDWNARYSDGDFIYGTEPNSFLVEHAKQLRGPVLSLAEGEGRNAVFLASLGLHVTGVDGSSVGVVNFQGKPIGKINVMLMPTAGSGKIAEGTTDDSGKFTLQTMQPGDGAMVGEYNVGFKFVPDEVPAMPGFEGAKKVVSPIPEKYADPAKSGFTAKVDADKSKNNFTFDLK